MQRFLIAVLLTLSSVGLVRGQETTGEKAEKAKAEVLKIEIDKVTALSKNGSDAATWFDNNNPDSVVLMLEGVFRTKAEQMAAFRSGNLYLISEKQHSHQVHVYNDGDTAVVTMIMDATFKRDDKPVIVRTLITNVWVRSPAGQWQRVVHATDTARDHVTVTPAMTGAAAPPK
jgi:ketosteroid isomerase-like protein